MGEVKANNFQKLLDLKDHIPLVLIVLYGLGYSYLKFFYFSFGIDFEYYISLTDIVFFSLEKILIFFLFFILFRAIVFVIQSIVLNQFLPDILFFSIKQFKNYDIVRRYIKLKKLSYNEWILVLMLVVSVFILFFALHDTIQNDGYRFTWLFYFMPVLFLEFLLTTENSKLKTDYFLIPMFYFVFSVVLGFTLLIISIGEANSFKNGVSHKEVQFSVGDIEYKTGEGPLKLLGETSNYFFLYDYKDEKSLIISKSDIDVIIAK